MAISCELKTSFCSSQCASHMLNAQFSQTSLNRSRYHSHHHRASVIRDRFAYHAQISTWCTVHTYYARDVAKLKRYHTIAQDLPVSIAASHHYLHVKSSVDRR